LDLVADDLASIGCAVTCSQFEHRQKNILRTVNTEFGIQQINQPENRKNVWNYRVHMLNYGQDPLIADPEFSSFKFVIEDIPLSKIITQYQKNPELYVKKNIESIIKDSKAEMYKDNYFYRDDKSLNDYTKSGVNRRKFFAQICINGNQDDDTKYYVEMIGDRIVRIQKNWLDYDEDFFTVFTMRNRSDYWWGNAPCEDVIPHENWMHMVMNLSADNVLKSMEKYIFYFKDALDHSDINARHSSGGWIPVSRKDAMQLQNVIYDMAPRPTDLTNLDYITREVKESAQKQSPKPDFLR